LICSEGILRSLVPGSLPAVIFVSSGVSGRSVITDSTAGELNEETGLGTPVLPTGTLVVLGVLVTSVVEFNTEHRVTASGFATENAGHRGGSVGVLDTSSAWASDAGQVSVDDATVVLVEDLVHLALLTAPGPLAKVGGVGDQSRSVKIVDGRYTGRESGSHLAQDGLEEVHGWRGFARSFARSASHGAKNG